MAEKCLNRNNLTRMPTNQVETTIRIAHSNIVESQEISVGNPVFIPRRKKKIMLRMWPSICCERLSKSVVYVFMSPVSKLFGLITTSCNAQKSFAVQKLKYITALFGSKYLLV